MASNTYPQYISGRARTVSPLSADPSRYSFLGLSNAEPNLGAPTGNASSKYFLLSETVSGARYWSDTSTIAVSGSFVGVGTATPNEKLTVVGNLSVTGLIYGTIESLSGALQAGGVDTNVQFNSAGTLAGNNGFVYNYSLSTITVGSDNINNAANSYVLGQSITAVAPNFTYVNNLTATNAVYANSFIATSGNSGFGTNIPNEKVTIVGNLSVTGTIFGALTAVAVPIAAGEDTYVQFNSGNNDIQAGNPAFTFLHTVSTVKIGGNHIVSNGSQFSGILGGWSNNINAACSVIAGGAQNVISNTHGAIGGGDSNEVNAVYGVVAGGRTNIANADYSAILGGIGNSTGDTYGSIGGGLNNNSNGYAAVVGGGQSNIANGFYTTVAGGCFNYVNADCGGILGGANNVVANINSFIIGSNITSTHANTTFVNNLSTPGSVCGGNGLLTSLTANNLTVNNSTISPTATATDRFLTLVVSGSTFALPLFKI